MLVIELLGTFEHVCVDQLDYLVSFDCNAECHGDLFVNFQLVVGDVVVEAASEGNDFLAVEDSLFASIFERVIWHGYSLKSEARVEL